MGTKQGPMARIMGLMVARVACLGLAPGHHARPRGTSDGMGGGMLHVSWLSSWAPCKTPWHASWHRWWHASWHGRWHASRVLARLASTMKGLVACVKVRMVASIVCLSSTRGHQARPGMRHGGTCRVSWLSSRAPCKVPWHVSWHGRWHASCVLAWLLSTMKGPCGMRHGTGGGTHPMS